MSKLRNSAIFCIGKHSAHWEGNNIPLLLAIFEKIGWAIFFWCWQWSKTLGVQYSFAVGESTNCNWHHHRLLDCTPFPHHHHRHYHRQYDHHRCNSYHHQRCQSHLSWPEQLCAQNEANIAFKDGSVQWYWAMMAILPFRLVLGSEANIAFKAGSGQWWWAMIAFQAGCGAAVGSVHCRGIFAVLPITE